MPVIAQRMTQRKADRMQHQCDLYVVDTVTATLLPLGWRPASPEEWLAKGRLLLNLLDCIALHDALKTVRQAKEDDSR